MSLRTRTFAVGDRVRHHVRGLGTVVSTTLSGPSRPLIRWDSRGLAPAFVPANSLARACSAAVRRFGRPDHCHQPARHQDREGRWWCRYHQTKEEPRP